MFILIQLARSALHLKQLRSVRKCEGHNGIVKKLLSRCGPFSAAPGLCLHRRCTPDLACLSGRALAPMWRDCPIWLDVPHDARALLGWTCAAASLPAHSRIAPPCSSPPPFPFLFPAPAAIVTEPYLIFLLFDCARHILTFSLASSSQNISQFALISCDFM